ncbi:RNase III domain-containing protein [Xylaria palmicola]|nr:RNase III domain-containing protein [Xylaria palmicola]
MALKTSRSTVSLSRQALRHYGSQNVSPTTRPLSATCSRPFATSASRPADQTAEAPRYSFTPPRMKAPFSPHLRKTSYAEATKWHVNEDPKALDYALSTFLGRGGDRLLPDELKWLAVTHKSFDQGRRGFNDRLAFLGRQICVMEAMESIITSPAEYQGIVADPFAHRRQPYEDAPLRSVDNLAVHQPTDLFTISKLSKLTVQSNLSKVVRWVPKNPGDESVSGFDTVMAGAVYALVGAVALQHGGKAARRIVHDKILKRIRDYDNHETQQRKQADQKRGHANQNES